MILLTKDKPINLRLKAAIKKFVQLTAVSQVILASPVWAAGFSNTVKSSDAYLILANKEIQSRVVDAAGNPLLGANIAVKGNNISAQTDMYVYFSHSVPDDQWSKGANNTS